jgi:hypothetical protein
MKQSHLHDGASSRALAEELKGGFYLGQLGHRTMAWR